MNRKPTIAVAAGVVATLVGVVALSGGASAAKRSGSRIVWSRFEGQISDRLQLVSARPDGSRLRVLTHPGKNTQDIDAAISPNGRLVAFERDRHNRPRVDTARVTLVRANGKGEHTVDLGCVDPCVADNAPTWLPGGGRIAFSPIIGPFDQPHHSARSAVLYTALRNGSDIRRLSQPGIDGKFEDSRARYSPDGSYIVFNRGRNVAPGGLAIFRMNADGSNVHRLTPWRLGADVIDLSPATSGPTENLIVFETYGFGPPNGKSQNVATVPSNCGSVSECRKRIRYLTRYRGGAVQAFNPAWSPNGRRIAYTKFKPGDKNTPAVGDIWTMRPDGSHRKPVSTSPLFEFRPDWGPAPRG
jgi:Tol biopolymer transport system component